MSNGTLDGAAPAAPGSVSPEPFDRLRSLLREMFQLDRGDLDFGLYRIKAMKAGEIEEFLGRDLLPQVKAVLAGVADEERAQIEAELAETVKQLTTLKAPVEDNEKVLDLRARLAEAKADADAEADVYGHLATFFGRMENMIKEHKLYTKSDRTSCHRWEANQFRLFLHTGAYWLLHRLRQATPRRSLWRKATFETIRRAFLKIAVRIEELKSRVRIALPSAYPYRPALVSMAGRIKAQGP